MSIRLGSYGLPLDEHETFLRQYGVEEVLGTFRLHPGYGATKPLFNELGFHWDLLDLVQLRNRYAVAGLRLIGLEQAVPRLCIDRIVLGEPGRDEQIEQLIITIRNMGRAGLSVLGYPWQVNPRGWLRHSWRTSSSVPGRGGAVVTAFDGDEISSEYLSRGARLDRETLFGNYEYFVERVLPVAEEAGVRLAVHPDDPPVESLGGADRLFYDLVSHRRALALSSSPNHGIAMCFGNWGVMPEDPLLAIKELGNAGRIVYCHLQGVVGKVPSYRECFLDESDLDWFAIFAALRDIGFDGMVIPAHFPLTALEPDPEIAANGTAYANGYVRALIQAVNGRRI